MIHLKHKPLLAALPLAILLNCCTEQVQKQPDNAIQLPTMGWSSWNTYRVHISDSLIMSQADAMVATGLKDAGYNHINIDDGYFGGRDAATGRLLIHPTRFPGGMKPVVDHIHALGLKAGIYSDAGTNTCGNYYDRDTIARGVGFYGHDQQDADFFSRSWALISSRWTSAAATPRKILIAWPWTRSSAIRPSVAPLTPPGVRRCD